MINSLYLHFHRTKHTVANFIVSPEEALDGFFNTSAPFFKESFGPNPMLIFFLTGG